MDERSDAYHDGAEAFRQGLTDADNPHPNGSDESMDWFDGWNDEANAA
ncbi:hypothetical protein [Burkholderia cenocepacia]|nr:hypothetical protein [Burkholderia cenocepacia]MEB2554080.1 hypothetical protein [Burkholderia cenocepacia]